MRVVDVARATVADAETEIDGKTLSVPALLVTDGLSFTYAVDVDIAQKRINPDSGEEEAAPLRNVPIAAGNRELIYADAGSAVRLRRSASGKHEVVGFSKRFPGTYNRIAVTIPAPGLAPIPYEIGLPNDIGISVRRLTYGEIETLGGYGVVRYGALGFFRGTTLVEVR